MTIEIRKALPSEASDILFFIKELAEYEKLSHEVSATVESLEETLFGSNKKAEVIFALSENKKVGFALFFESYSTFLAKSGVYLEDLFVLEEHRGRGFGKALLRHLANVVIERGGARLEWSVLNWNTPSIEFYESIGAERLSEWSTYRLVGESLHKLSQ